MRALILLNGLPPCESLIKKYSDSDLIICCDGAANYAYEFGMHVDALVGDFDSLGKTRAKELASIWNCEFVELEEKKDFTDGHFATEYAASKKATEIIFLGALGGRFDHALTNVYLLTLCKQLGIDGIVIDEKNEIRATCTSIIVEGEAGDKLSLLPLGVNVKVKCTEGLEYPLYDRDMSLGNSIGVSNVFSSNRAYVEVSSGWLLVIKSKD